MSEQLASRSQVPRAQGSRARGSRARGPRSSPDVDGRGRTGRLLDDVSVHAVADRRPVDCPRPDDLEANWHRHGSIVLDGPDGSLLHRLEAADLTGHGGGHFPVARKWRTALAAATSSGSAPVVVANAAEGEPLSAKDLALLHARPHLVLDGLSTAVAALGARTAVVWVHAGAQWVHEGLVRAVAQRREAGLDPVPIEVVLGPDGYLTGESSAVVRALDGGPALPTFTRTPSAQRGVGGHPTVVHNVETLARLGLISRGGSATSPAPLVTVVDPDHLIVCQPGPGATTAEVLATARPWQAGRADPAAVLVGGYGGRWLRWDEVASRPVADLTGEGPATLGAGVLAPLPATACGLRDTARILDFLARASAGQCGPCVNGTRALADRMAALADGSGRRRDTHRLLDLVSLVNGRGACGLPDGAARLAVSALSTFAADVERHARRKPCAGDDHVPVPGPVRVPGPVVAGGPR